MNSYTIYCTEEQTRKALEFGAPIGRAKYMSDLMGEKYFFDNKLAVIIPTAEQMIGWLEEQGFHFDFEYTTMTCCMVQYNYEYINYPTCGARKEATIAAIDAALKYLGDKNLIK